MAQRKRKFNSIHDNISLEGLDAVFDVENLKTRELEVMEQSPLEKFGDIINDTIKNKLKAKTNRKAAKKFLEDLPEPLKEGHCAVFESSATTKVDGKKKTKLKEVFQLIVVHENSAPQLKISKTEDKIVFLEDREEAVVDILPDSDRQEDTSISRALEDQLLAAHCRVDIANAKVESLKEKLNLKDKALEEKEEEIIWLKSQQDMISKELSVVKNSWWWRLGSWLNGSKQA